MASYYIMLYYTIYRKVHEITQHDTTSCCIYKDNLLCCHLQLVTTKLD